MTLSPEQLFQRDLIVATGQGMLKGLLHRGRPVTEAQAVVSQSLDQRADVARQLVAMDAADHPDEGRAQRLANLGQLMEAVIYGAIAKGQGVQDALNLANRQRDRLFVAARGSRDDTPEVVGLAMTLKAGVLQGRMMAGADFESAHSEARQTDDACLSIARRLHDINQADYPAHHGDVRLKAVGQLFAAGISGSLQRQDRVLPTKTLLRDLYDKHTALFASAQRTLDEQLDRQMDRPTLGQALGAKASPAAVSPGLSLNPVLGRRPG